MGGRYWQASRLRLGLSRICIAVAVVTTALAACSHPGNPASATPSNPPAASAAATASPAASSPTPCPAESGWTGENLSTAPPNPAAWLTAAQMPEAAVYHWTAEGSPAAMPFVQDMWNVLNSVGAANFQAWQLLYYQGSTNGVSASQTIYLYANGSQAYCAYQSAIAAAAGNQAASRSFQVQRGMTADAVTTETLSGQHESAWTQSWTAPSSPANFAGPQTDVEYIVQVGTALTYVSFEVPGLDQSVPDAATAQATLSEIAQHLSVYATGS